MWKLEAGERIARWRAFRIEIGGMPLPKAIQETAQLWQNCPHKPHYLDHEDPEAWPNAWDLISENYYCDLAKALGMLYTLYFTVHGKQLEPEIRVYYDPETKYTYNLVLINQGKYVINFMDGEIVNIESVKEKFKLKRCYDSTLLKLK